MGLGQVVPEPGKSKARMIRRPDLNSQRMQIAIKLLGYWTDLIYQ